MRMNLSPGRLLLPALVLFIVVSCKKEVRDSSASQQASIDASLNAERPAKAKSDLLKSVRNSTARFHSTRQAIKAGYIPDDHCVSVPGVGGMGYHWLNPSLVDPVFDPRHPEVVLYANGPGGKLRLVALEYIVIDIGQDRPMFGDHPFDIGGTPVPDPHWSLHVWLYEENPNGIFTPFNPKIVCP